LSLLSGAQHARQLAHNTGFRSQKFQWKDWISGRALVYSVAFASTSALTVLCCRRKFVVGAAVEESRVLLEEDVPNNNRQRFNFMADIVEKVSPGVVFIEVQGQHMFGLTQRNGSGFVIRADGMIMTNAHTVSEVPGMRQQIMVKLNNGEEYVAQVLYVDTILDLAVLKINAKNLPVLKFADSSKARPGEWVIAMGSPFSLSNTVTKGVISNAHRKSAEVGLNKPIDYIQTDAAINEGNSGGPLINLDGEVVGINSMTVAVANGISFAIPSNIAKKFVLDFEENEKETAKSSSKWFSGAQKVPAQTKRRALGITIVPLDAQILQELRRHSWEFPQVSHGILIHSVIVGSAAHTAGIQPGDVIVEVNGKAAKSAEILFRELETTSRVTFSIARRRESIFKITVDFDM